MQIEVHGKAGMPGQARGSCVGQRVAAGPYRVGRAAVGRARKASIGVQRGQDLVVDGLGLPVHAHADQDGKGLTALSLSEQHIRTVWLTPVPSVVSIDGASMNCVMTSPVQMLQVAMQVTHQHSCVTQPAQTGLRAICEHGAKCRCKACQPARIRAR
jgi:hypothetical protein